MKFQPIFFMPHYKKVTPADQSQQWVKTCRYQNYVRPPDIAKPSDPYKWIGGQIADRCCGGADSRTRTRDQGLSIKRRHIVFWFFVCNRCICTVMPPWIIHSPCRVFRQICNKSQSAEMFFRPQLVLCDEQQFCLSAHLVLRHPTCRLWCIFL